MIEEISGGHSPGQPKAGSIGNRSVGNYEEPAFVIPDVLVSCNRDGTEDHQQNGSAASRIEQQAHQGFQATSRNSYFSLER
jgi:hypothetical protein